MRPNDLTSKEAVALGVAARDAVIGAANTYQRPFLNDESQLSERRFRRAMQSIGDASDSATEARVIRAFEDSLEESRQAALLDSFTVDDVLFFILENWDDFDFDDKAGLSDNEARAGAYLFMTQFEN